MRTVTPEEIFATQYRSWFSAVFGGSRVSQGVVLDPYASSMRRSGVMVGRMKEIRATGVPGGDANQVVTDLAAAGLVERAISPSGSPVSGEGNLTSLGAEVLAEWEALGIDESAEQFEIARGVVLIRLGIDTDHPTYVRIFGFWSELTSLQPARYWLQDGWHMYAPSYLNQADSAGFNPFSVLAALNRGQIWTRDEWAAWAKEDAELAPAINKFLERVPVTRLEGRRAFCRAMELYRLHSGGFSQSALESTLTSWRSE